MIWLQLALAYAVCKAAVTVNAVQHVAVPHAASFSPEYDAACRTRANRERKCADTIGTVLVPWAGHFQC